MKKLFIILLFLCMLFSLTSCGQEKSAQEKAEDPLSTIPTKPSQEINPDYVNSLSFINEDAPATKVFHYKGKDIKLVYRETWNKNKLPLEERADAYGFYDVYVDKIGTDNTEFEFLFNTNLLCGMFCNDYPNLSGITPISEDTAVENVLAFLKAHYPANAVAEYILEYCSLDSNYGQSYSINFYKMLQGIKTDDQIYLIEKIDGTITALNANHIYRYDQFIDTLPKINKPKTEEALMKQATERVAAKQTVTDYHVEYKIQDEYITMNEKGELVLAQEIFWSISGEPIPDKICIPFTEGDIFYQPLEFE